MNRIIKGFLFVQFILGTTDAFASEGFWLPHLLKDNVEEHMQSMGLQLSAEDIYSVNQSSLKDAIVNFGGCTGSIISPEGLLLTNHHCGFGRISSHSSPENNYLRDGFWAMSHQEELPNSGLKVYFIKRIEDVTSRINEKLAQADNETQRTQLLYEVMAEIEQEAVEDNHYEAEVKSFYFGNKYYLFIKEVYQDVRLVAAPPAAIGKFGGDTDNWMWPRHTGDFSLFRIYTAPDGSPATYSEENIPMQSPNFLPVATNGVRPGDFTMVFGFPGSTNEYLTSQAVEFIVNDLNPQRINIRRQVLDIIEATMGMNDTLQLLYAARQAGIANYYKKWMGENMGLKRFNAIAKKKSLEADFMLWAKDNDFPALQLFEQFEKVYKTYNQNWKAYTYINESLQRVEAVELAQIFADRFYLDNQKHSNEKLINRVKAYYKRNHLPTEKKLFQKMIDIYISEIDAQYLPESLKNVNDEYGSVSEYTDKIFAESLIFDLHKLERTLTASDKKKEKSIKNDPMIRLAAEILLLKQIQVRPGYVASYHQLQQLYSEYIVGLKQMQSEKAFYPDANSTLRLSYGKIEGSYPHDGLQYLPATTLEGIMQKEDINNPDFKVPEKLKKLYQAKDFGSFVDGDSLVVCFLASNHTTGGNSGSPVINGKGELIGLNFDRSWESTMSDIMYNQAICRNISVDIRYILFLIEKYGEAEWLLEEMNLMMATEEVE